MQNFVSFWRGVDKLYFLPLLVTIAGVIDLKHVFWLKNISVQITDHL